MSGVLRFGVVLACVLVWLSVGRSVGHAQGQSRRGGAASSEYDQALREALTEFGRGNWVEARSLFERAHELQPSARTLRAIGLAAFEEKRYVLATTTLAASLEDQRKPLNAAQRQEVEDAMRRAEGFVARFTLEIVPANATVRVDAAPAVISAGTLLLDPGEHELVISAEGFETLERRILAQPREQRPLRLALRSNQRVPEPAAAVVPTTLRPPVTGARIETEVSDDDPLFSTQQYIGIGVGAVGVLSLAASLYFGLRAKSEYDDSGCASGGCADLAAKKLNERALVSGNIATGLGIGGLAAAGAGAFLILWSPSPEQPLQSATLRLSPTLSPAQGGLQLEGVF